MAEQASEILEALGADDMAIKALELRDLPLTPLQKDIMKFFADHPEFVKFAVRDDLT